MSTSRHSPTGIAFDRAGPGDLPPTVLIHAGVADRRMWDPQWPELTSVRDCVRLDLRGFGDSTTAPVGSVSHVGDVIDTLDHLGIDTCHLIGASLGSGVAVEVALTRPRLARSVVLCPPGGSLLAELTPDLQRFFEAEKSALERSDLEAAVEANISTWLVGPGRSQAEVDPTVVAAVREMQRRAFQVSARWGEVAEAELEPAALDRLADLAAPALVLVGGHDLATTHDAALRLRVGVRLSRQVDWPGVAHLPSMERPAQFLALLLDWVSSHD